MPAPSRARHVVEIDIDRRYAKRVDATLLRDTVVATLDSCRLRRARAISVTIADTRTVRRLNRRYLDDDSPTDVLAFNVDIRGLRRPDGVEDLGALIIALPVAAAGAKQRHVQLIDEMALLVAHGTLHLLGFDHETRPDDAHMRQLEVRALSRLGRPQAARK